MPRVNDSRYSRSLPSWLRVLGAPAVIAALLVAGCGRGAGQPAGESRSGRQRAETRAEASPEELLRAVFARYRHAASYRDAGQVHLSYRVQGQYRREVAPLSVWFDRDTLYVEAYGVRLWSDPEGFTAWIQDPSTDDFDSQVLRGEPLGARPELEKLLADPVLAGRLTSGLAGPPPQLEWLFAAEPMKRLFGDDTRFEYQGVRPIGERPCRRIRVSVDGDRYVFWIDRSQGTIRRVELPPIHSPASPDIPAQQMQLTLELSGASFAAPDGDPAVAPLPARPQYVRRFVPLPPPEPSRMLGRRCEPFQLVSVDGAVELSDSGSDREVTVIALVTGDPGALATAAALQHWQSMMPPSMSRRVRSVLVVDETARELLPREITLPVIIDRQDVAQGRLRLSSGAVAVLDSRGRLAWTQRGLAPSGLAAFGATVADVLDGVNVPERLRDQWQSDRDEYRRQLAEQSWTE